MKIGHLLGKWYASGPTRPSQLPLVKPHSVSYHSSVTQSQSLSLGLWLTKGGQWLSVLYLCDHYGDADRSYDITNLLVWFPMSCPRCPWKRQAKQMALCWNRLLTTYAWRQAYSLTNRMLLLCHVTPCSEAVKDWLLYNWDFVTSTVILCYWRYYWIKAAWISARKYPLQKWSVWLKVIDAN